MKLGIADDHTLFRKGVIELIIAESNHEFILEAQDGEDLMKKLQLEQPDVLLLDLKMPKMDGIEATPLIKAQYPNVKIITLSMHNEEKFILHMIELGVHSYLQKDVDPLILLAAIDEVADKGYYYTPQVARVMATGLNKKRQKPNVNGKVNVTERELEVLKHICDGLTNSEIADKVYLSQRTIEGYRQKLIEKTGTRNTAELVAWAFKSGLMS